MSVKIITKYMNVVVDGDNAPMDVCTVPFEIGDVVWCALHPFTRKKTRKGWKTEIEKDYAAYQGVVNFIGFDSGGPCLGVDVPSYDDNTCFIKYPSDRAAIWLDNSYSHLLVPRGEDLAVKWCAEQNMKNQAIREVKIHPMLEV